jgi:hypothetical protein
MCYYPYMLLNRDRAGRVYSWLLLISLCLGACEEGEVKMQLLVYDKASDSYLFNAVPISTLDDVSRLDGDATVLKGGLSIEIDYGKGQLDWKELGHPVVFSAFENDGVLIPETYDSLAMASVYYSMELSYLFFRDELGVDETLLKRIPSYYKPKVVLVDSTGERLKEEDNAFYMRIAGDERAFFIINHSLFQWIPMSLNSGIITHEYTHYVFDTLVLEKKTQLDSASENLLLAINEGTADFYATAFEIPVCGSSQYVELSRDIANTDVDSRNYTFRMERAAESATSLAEFCPYEIGLFWASMLYEIALTLETDPLNPEEPSREALVRVGRWLMAALRDLGVRLQAQDTFSVSDIMSLLAGNIESPEDKESVCDIIESRYNLKFYEVDGC